MEKGFWTDKWQNGFTPWHANAIQPDLIRFFPELVVASGGTILVPLCGKSSDILWLADSGFQVIGVEIVPLAVEQFFSDNDLKFDLSNCGDFVRYASDTITILCGDFLQLDLKSIEPIAAVYDRAALIAFPLEMRKHYYRKMTDLSPCTKVLLDTFELDNDRDISSSPFPVRESEIRSHLEPAFEITVLRERRWDNDRGTDKILKLVRQ